MLKIEHLYKKFHDRLILNNVSLQVKSGEIAVLLGSSGVGKSTLLRIINNLEQADSGSITLDDKPIVQSGKQRAAGMVFQQFNLFDHLTVEENITLALTQSLGKTKQEAHVIAKKLLEHYGLADKAQVYPPQLSGGQKQRLAIARALALNPKIICFDEPTSALDPLLTSAVAKNIEHLREQGYIILVATHDTTLLERLDCTIYLMDKGEIIEHASSKEFYKNQANYPAIKQFVRGE